MIHLCGDSVYSVVAAARIGADTLVLLNESRLGTMTTWIIISTSLVKYRLNLAACTCAWWT